MRPAATFAQYPADAGTTNALLVALYLLGIYLGIDLQVARGLPVPTVLAGFAGLLLLLVNRNRIEQRHVAALALIITCYLASILFAADNSLLKERFKGFIQISYSLIIGYSFFLAFTRMKRRQLAGVLLAFCSAIVIGCILENYTGFRAVSDAFRNKVFSFGVYNADLRDLYLYGRIRPKLFTSEPSVVTYSYTLFLFAWYVVSTWRHKLSIYLLYLAAGLIFMRGPTLLIGAVLIIPYQLFLAARREGPHGVRYDSRRILGTLFSALLIGSAVTFLTQEIYTARLEDILSGRDPSFFGRIIAPVFVAIEMIRVHPLAGAGLTGWEFIDPIVREVYATSPNFILQWAFATAAEGITNYFWSHWIFLGLVWGLVLAGAWIVLLRALQIPSIAFPLTVWVCLGHASGAYVSPRTWTVLFLASGIALLYQREPARTGRQRAGYAPAHPFPFTSPTRQAI